MILLPRNAARIAATAAFALLAGCAQMNQPAPPPNPVAYNPPAAAVTELPAAQATHYRMNFAAGGTRLDAEGAAMIASIADTMRANPGLMATLIGSADPAGTDASNMRLSKRRAIVVHDALRRGKVPESRIDTRWTGERQADDTPELALRTVEIILH